MKKWMITILITCTAIFSHAQYGAIRGTIIDSQSEIELIGATVRLIDTTQTIGTSTDLNGTFELENVPLGRNSIEISYLGYEKMTLSDLEISAGKEVVLNISLREEINNVKEVTVTANSKENAKNELSVVSSRQFSLEEVNRYSGGRSDVARLVSNFAGVSTANDSRNDIVIRGNSPTGVLWRIEGIPVPSPNHFSTFGTSGSPVSALNPNIMSNSDFLTSAFPAEYGNANAGVFDIDFKSGNNKKREYTFQVGLFSGIEAMAEGPMTKNGGSYIVSARYSLTGIIGNNPLTNATPEYSDLSFNLDFGNSKAGRFSIFGIGGLSNIEFIGEEIDSTDLLVGSKDTDSYVKTGFGVAGLKHTIILNDKNYIRTTIGGSYRFNDFDRDRYFNYETPEEQKLRVTEVNDNESRITVSSYINSKFSSKVGLRAGILYENFRIDANFDDRETSPDLDMDGEPDWLNFYNFNGNFSLIQPYVQLPYRINKDVTLNLGLHGQYSTLNKQFAVEPRVSLSYQVANNHKLNIGYGLHNQTAPLPVLFLNEQVGSEMVQTNKNLDFIRSQHLVLGYDASFGTDWRIKTELYYQFIDKAAVEKSSSSYSSLTEGADFVFSNDKVSLVNEGTGFNRGLEITIEKFFNKSYYILATTSLFQSKYKGSDDVERNTPFNNGYVVNMLGGKEFQIGKRENKTIFFDTKLTFSGGKWYTPIDILASQNAGFEIRKDNEAFSKQADNYFRWDIKAGVKINSKKRKVSQKIFFDLQNITNHKNAFDRRYNRTEGEIQQTNQNGFFPDFGYQIQF